MFSVLQDILDSFGSLWSATARQHVCARQKDVTLTFSFPEFCCKHLTEMEIQQDFTYDVFWDQWLVSGEALFFPNTEKQESLLSTEAMKGKKHIKQVPKVYKIGT